MASLAMQLTLFSPLSARRPNVVFVVVDDLGWTDLGCYGSTFYDTPNLDRLATQSIRFTQAYAASPVCSPTRAALLTGRHPVRIGITDWIPGMPDDRADQPQLRTPEDLHFLPLDELTISEIFHKAGYLTFFAGKWHLGETPGFWPEAQGFQINKGGNGKGSPTFPGGNGYYAPYGNPTLEEGPPGEYLTDRLTEESIRFIASAAGAPFFLYLSFYTVHTPIQGCESFDQHYREKCQELPDGGKMQTRAEHLGKTRINQSDPLYAAMVRSMDENVGRLLDAIREQGLQEQTIVIFTSDNGGLSTTSSGGPTSVVPLRAGKGWCYEGGIRIPLLIRYPGISDPGKECHQPVISMDLFPTLLELASLDPSEGLELDGRSLTPYLTHPGRIDNRTLIWHYPHYHGSTWRPGSAIRQDDWKLLEFYEDRGVELYDLSSDPQEKNNLAPGNPLMADSLRKELHRELRDLGAKYPARRTNSVTSQ
jgi:arylsulfatase A-like enzyme